MRVGSSNQMIPCFNYNNMITCMCNGRTLMNGSTGKHLITHSFNVDLHLTHHTCRHVATVKTDDTDVRLYTILFEDDDVIPDVVRSKIQFLERLELENMDKRTRDLMSIISSSVSVSAKTNNSIIDLTRNKKITDPERAEVYGQNDLC